MHEKRFQGEIARLRDPDRVNRLEVDRVVDLCLEDNHPARVLDVGTGTALFAEAFSRRGLEVAGVDVSPEMLAAARGFVPSGDFREAVAEALPFPDHAFDLVFLGVVLHEADDPLKALQEALRTTRHRVCILEWPYREQSFGAPLHERLKPEEIEDLFTRAGFKAWRTAELSNTVLYLLDN